MRKVTTRMVLLVGALVLAAATPPALRKAAQVRQASCAAYASTAKSGHLHACRSKRGGWCCGPRLPASEEAERLFDCLLSQPFETCD